MEKRELSFLRTGHDVDLVERALETSDPVAICVARAKSKEYISLKIVEEVSRKEFYRKNILFVATEEKGKFNALKLYYKYINKNLI